jgi:hypothetical protein
MFKTKLSLPPPRFLNCFQNLISCTKRFRNVFYLFGFLVIPIFFGCQKEVIDKKESTIIPATGISNTKMLFDMVKAYNNHNISNRDEISYTFPEALGEIIALHSVKCN